jgi:exosortase
MQRVSAEKFEGYVEMAPHQQNGARIIVFALLSIIPIVFVCLTMKSLAAITLRDDTYSHIPLIPAVSLFLLYLRRRTIFDRLSSAWKTGISSVLLGVACIAFGEANPLHWSTENRLSMAMLGVVLIWAGSFALCFGSQALRLARFPFFFLFFMIPLPEFVLHQTITFLQQESADASAFIFGIFGIPYLRQGVDFALPGVVIRVAEECSGIRSTLALLIMAILLSYWCLRTFWKKALLCLLIFPVAIFKNGLRIVTLSTLAVYVNPGFLHGRLHEYGGVAFFGAGLIPLLLVLRILQMTEPKAFHLPQT